ncbi:SdpI family protein [Lacrimispora amygdalina]|uniref:SdpI family protein n=1 Tax=Lacrimispora amygdalina TaxID=253257 RepID=UPI000BE2AA32|nr:SdpI family protein [Lacrimispora amygdalina]
MTFWIFITAMELLLPLVMIVIGNLLKKKPPQKINNLAGYRTTMSMKNKDTWEFAHHHCGKVWQIVGFCMLVPSFVAMLAVLGKGTDTVGMFGTLVITVQMVILIGSIIPTELALRKHFDKEGKRLQL